MTNFDSKEKAIYDILKMLKIHGSERYLRALAKGIVLICVN